VSVNTVHWFDASSSVTVTPVNTSITFITSTVPGLHFSRWQYMRIYSSANFRTVFSESQNAFTHQMPSSEHILTLNDHSKSFKVICFGVSEEPLRGYIVQYNNCGLACEGSEDIASERSDNRHFRPPHTYMTPPIQRTSANIHINLTLL